MENTKKYTWAYAIVSIVAIAYIILRDVVFYKYKTLCAEPLIEMLLITAAPIVIAILSYIKMLIQNRTPVQYSSIINIAIIATLIFWMFAFFPMKGLHLMAYNIATVFFLVLQICALIYDFFRSKHRIETSHNEEQRSGQRNRWG